MSCYKIKEKKKMAKNRTAFAIALFLMATITVTLVALPTANAHDPPWEIVTYAFISTTLVHNNP